VKCLLPMLPWLCPRALTEQGWPWLQGTQRFHAEALGKVALVLGAGNQTAVAALDILHKLIAENAVVICKMNPVNEYAGPYLM
jgi:hypothetical protein